MLGVNHQTPKKNMEKKEKTVFKSIRKKIMK
jgi:hypothetical protein